MHGVIKASVREVDFPVETFYFEAKLILIEKRIVNTLLLICTVALQ